MHKRQVRNQRHFIQPLTCYGSVLNVLLKIPQHEANHKFTFTGQSEKKKKGKKKKTLNAETQNQKYLCHIDWKSNFLVG